MDAPLAPRDGGAGDGGRPSPPRSKRPAPPGQEPGVSLRERLRRRLAALSGHEPSEPRYVVEDEIARGGMGAVLRVWDDDLHRRAAMKVCLEETDPDALGEPEARALERFLTEAEITGQLDHPGIVPVHEMGVDPSGRPFFTMRLVQGRSLLEILEGGGDDRSRWSAARIVREVLLKGARPLPSPTRAASCTATSSRRT